MQQTDPYVFQYAIAKDCRTTAVFPFTLPV